MLPFDPKSEVDQRVLKAITAACDQTLKRFNADPGSATARDDYSLERYILSTNHYQIELLTNLDQDV